MSNFSPSQWVWYTAPDGSLIAAQFQKQTGSDASLLTADNEAVSAPLASIKPMHPSSANGVEDMILLGELHEASLLHNLSMRFMKDDVYTYTGNILVAMNPYKSLPIYAGEMIRKYQGKQLGELSPHIYAIANETYYCMLRTKTDQCVVISGESGAGKTESTKLILNFLATVSTKKSLVQDQIIDASPILEAFGNAKTVRNDNSSRFGKFLEIQFEADGSIAGAMTLQYLLEKSRIVSQAPEERNYHIFYDLIAGATPAEKAELGLQSVQDYRYINQSGCFTLKNVNDGEAMREVREAMHTLNFKKFEMSIFKALAIVLHLGNVTFQKIDENGLEAVVIDDISVVQTISKLIGLDESKLMEALIKRTTVTRGETFITPLTLSQANDARDAIAKAIYGRMFNWIVSQINETTQKQEQLSFVGVLDIFGFEDFAVNSFEQFCINFANERLQYFFNQHIFKLEQEEYAKEGINWSKIDFVDNQSTIDLISKRPVGLLNILDEESNFPKATDQTLLAKFHENFQKDASYIKPKTQQPFFGVKHYAGDVVYQIEGFLEKNKDTLRQDLQDLLRECKHELICQWFDVGIEVDERTKTGTIARNATMKKSAKQLTSGYQFNASLNDLITTLTSCNPFFVRCIKPNAAKVQRKLERAMVMAQLRYSGMIETIKVRKAGFTGRTKYEDFIARYGIVVPEAKKLAESNPKEAVKKILSQCPDVTKDQWQLGVTKVFLKGNVENAMEAIRAQKLVVFVLKLQAFFKMSHARHEFKEARKNICVIQKYVRAYLAKIRAKKWKRAVVRLQAIWRARKVRIQYKSELAKIEEARKAREAEERRLEEEEKRKEEEERRKEEEERIKAGSEQPIQIAEDEDEEFRRKEEEMVAYLENKEAQPKSAKKKRDPFPSEFRRFVAVESPHLYAPLETNDFIHLPLISATETIEKALGQRKAQNGSTNLGSVADLAAVANDEELSNAFTKFARIYFRNGSKPSHSSKHIKDSLLKLPNEAVPHSILINRVLLKLINEEHASDIITKAVNFISNKLIAMQSVANILPGGLLSTDELLCQLARMTIQNTDRPTCMRAWKYLSFFLGIYAPSPKFMKYLNQYLISDCPDATVTAQCQQRMARSIAQGSNIMRGITSPEVQSFFTGKPLTFEAKWFDDVACFFEGDASIVPAEVINQIARKRGFEFGEGYSLAIEYMGVEYRLNPLDNIMDAISKIEKEMSVKSQVSMSDFSSVGSKAGEDLLVSAQIPKLGAISEEKQSSIKMGMHSPVPIPPPTIKAPVSGAVPVPNPIMTTFTTVSAPPPPTSSLQATAGPPPPPSPTKLVAPPSSKRISDPPLHIASGMPPPPPIMPPTTKSVPIGTGIALPPPGPPGAGPPPPPPPPSSRR